MRHDYEAASACTEWFYSTRCWECTGCGNFFTHEDCADEYKKDKDMLYFPPVGHNLKNIPAKDATCVDKGTVEYWHCERCGLNFSDNEGENELTNIETDAPLLPHNYDDNGVCSFTEEHVEEQYKKSSADYTHNDVYYKTCSCGAVSTTETFEVPGTALNHDWAKATCTEPKTCRREGCGATDGNPLGHDLPNDWSKDENKHWHECERCHSKEDEGDHEYGDDNTAFIWIALLLICASTAAVTVIYGRRKKQR